jgi:2-(1,2-epoxy-1,2-dihydrophenyl)acetyl-CoA isomerase
VTAKYVTVKLERDGALARLTLNRPGRRNGMTRQMVRECHEALSQVAGDDSVRVLLLTGAGSSFCPGADLGGMVAGEDDADNYCEPEHFQVPSLLHTMPQVTIAAINGACAGAAFGWVCGADIRVATRSAMLNTAFLNVAVAGDMGVPWSLPRLVGAAKARELSFFTQKFSADDAQHMGLVARVWDDEVFGPEVDGLCQELVDRSPTALLTMKAHYLAAEDMGFQDYVDTETVAHQGIVGEPHAREAMAAFIEKRKPVFN